MTSTLENVSIIELKDEDLEQTLEFGARIFFQGEPLEANDPTHTLDKSRLFFEAIKPYLIFPACTIAKDINTNAVVGCRLAVDELSEIDFSSAFGPMVLEIWGAVRNEFKSQNPNIKKGEWVHFVGLCVEPSYTNIGIAKLMYCRSEQASKVLGFKNVVVETSSAYSRAAVIKLGYNLVTQIDYENYVFKDGTAHYKDMPQPHKYICLFVKDL